MILDPQFGHKLDSQNAQSMEELLAWIEDLAYLSDKNKAWAKADAKKRHEQGEDLQELQDKYDVYNQIGEIRSEIIQNVPPKKQKPLHQFLDDQIINLSTGSERGRFMKRDRMQSVLTTVRIFRSQQIDLQSLVRRTLTTSDIDFQVLEILNAELYKNLEKIFDDNFWSLSRKLSPQLFPYFTDAFDFAVRKSFTLERSAENLKSFPAALKKGVLQDAAHITSSFFPEEEAKKALEALAKIPENKPAALLQALLDLQKRHAEYQTKAQKQERFDALAKEREERAEAREKAREEALKKRQEERERAEEKIEKREEEATDKKQESEDKPVIKIETSLEKETKIKFLERCIDHAQRVLEMCEQRGIPKDDPKFWGEEGIKNRVKWLEDHGFYNMYKTFNASDRNMPKQERVKGVRFRWLDAQRGSNLSFSRAHEGLKYLQRYKESGYEIATLAGGFSCDWNTNGPNYRTPEKFILLVTEELNKVRGTSSGKLAMAA